MESTKAVDNRNVSHTAGLDTGRQTAPDQPNVNHRSARRTTSGAFLLAVCLGLGMLAALAFGSAFPTSLRVPVGEGAERLTNAFVEKCAWLYDPVATVLDQSFGWLLYGMTVVPAPLLAVALVILVWCTAGTPLALLTGATLALTVSFGLWESTKETLALMAVAVVVSTVIGIAVGVIAVSDRRLESAVRLVLDAMQTYPMFAYLVPAVVIFGAGNAAALVVTIIWAVPPVTRMTMVGIRGVSQETVEAAEASGATRVQLLTGVLLPLARPSIRAGINQTVMFAITMAIIASMIGAAGLGEPVWTRLRLLQFGQALEAGLVLVLIAIILDRALAATPQEKAASHVGQHNRARARIIRVAAGIGLLVVCTIAAYSIPGLRTADFANPPASVTWSVEGVVNPAIDWLNVNMGFLLDGIRETIQTLALNPVTGALDWLPWTVVLAVVFVLGKAALGGKGATWLVVSAAGVGALGMWDAATYTLGFVAVAVLAAIGIGVPLGIASSSNDRTAAAMRPLLDVTQSLPVFLFVIPAVVLLGPGPVAGLLATIAFAVPPVVRLTNVALRGVDPAIVEAAQCFGATPWQVLRHVRLVVGLPTILVGLNQCVMLALSMAVVSAFIGTPGLGREILLSVADADLALGVQAGLAMFLVAVSTDRVISGVVRRVAKTPTSVV